MPKDAHGFALMSPDILLAFRTLGRGFAQFDAILPYGQGCSANSFVKRVERDLVTYPGAREQAELDLALVWS